MKNPCNTFVKLIFIILVLNTANAKELDNEKNKSLSLKMIFGAGVGMNFLEFYQNISPRTTDYNKSFLGEIHLGTELMFKNGNGINLNAILEVSNNFNLEANYVYESQGTTKYALLTGFDGGIGYRSDIWLGNEKPFLRYNLAFRVGNGYNAFSIGVKVPLLKNHFDNGISKYDYYQGITLMLSFHNFLKLY